MDIESLRSHAKAAFDRAAAKKNLAEQMRSRLTVTHRSGVFVVDAELFVLLDMYEDDGWNNETVLVDAYDTPILVNRQELRSLARQRYQEILNEWLVEWESLKKVRRAADA